MILYLLFSFVNGGIFSFFIRVVVAAVSIYILLYSFLSKYTKNLIKRTTTIIYKKHYSKIHQELSEIY
jgi:hypothetical protein